jgi:general secretion pathway protein D
MNLGSSVERVTYPLKYAQAQAVAQLLRLSLPIGTVILSSIPTNSVVIGGDADTQRTAASVVSALDKPSTQSLSQEFVLQYQDPTTTLAALKLGIDTTQFTYTAVANQTNNAVVVTGPPASVDAVKSFLASFDRPGKQVSFKIRVVDLEPTDSSNIGLIFGSTDSTGAVTQGSSFTDFLTRSYPLNATLNAMITKGSAQVLAEPTIKTLNNTPGKFLVGTVYPAVYNTSNGLVNTSTVQDVNVGVVVDLTPTVGADGSVKVLLHAEVSQINGFNATYPIIGTREIDDTLVLSDNQTLVIGGLREDSDTSTVMKVPGLGDIPLIGGLFKNKQTSNTHSEIAFFITPTIENSAPGQPADLVNPVHPEPPASANPPVLNSPLKDLKPGS